MVPKPLKGDVRIRMMAIGRKMVTRATAMVIPNVAA